MNVSNYFDIPHIFEIIYFAHNVETHDRTYNKTPPISIMYCYKKITAFGKAVFLSSYVDVGAIVCIK